MAELTQKEKQVLAKVAVGKTNAEIGREMGISVSTVKVHVSSLLPKLACRNRVKLAVKAIHGFIPSEDTVKGLIELNWGSDHSSGPY